MQKKSQKNCFVFEIIASKLVFLGASIKTGYISLEANVLTKLI